MKCWCLTDQNTRCLRDAVEGTGYCTQHTGKCIRRFIEKKIEPLEYLISNHDVSDLVIQNNGMRVTLLERQFVHYSRILNILKTNNFFIDTSQTGSGKTWTTMAVAINRNMPLFVVCPKVARATWISASTIAGVQIVDIVTYESLRGTEKSQPKKYLSRTDYKIDNKSIVTFAANEDFAEIWTGKVLVVFDEIHKASTNSTTMEATSALFRLAVSTGSKSRIAMLSATPIDQKQFAVSFFKLIGYITFPLYSIIGKNQYSAEAQKAKKQLLKLCSGKNVEKTEEISKEYLNQPMMDLSYMLLHSVIKPLCHSEMPKPNYGFTQDNKIKCYKYDDQGEMNEALRKLTEIIVKKDKKIGEELPAERREVRLAKQDPAEKVKMKMAMILKELNNVHKLKVPLCVRIILHQLNIEEQSKILFFADLVESVLKPIQVKLEEYGYKCLRITGDMNERDISDSIKLFNETNTDYRIILITTSKGVSINLQDTHGDYPRRMFILPGFRLKDMQQAAGRCLREGVKSDTTLRIISINYNGDSSAESIILNNLKIKSETIKEWNLEKNIEYIGLYKKEVETEEEYMATLKVQNLLDSEPKTDTLLEAVEND
jgi:superfamily II DNA or RNA helicase